MCVSEYVGVCTCAYVYVCVHECVSIQYVLQVCDCVCVYVCLVVDKSLHNHV